MRICIGLWRMYSGFPRGDDRRRHIHGGCQGLRVVVAGDGRQHAGKFRGAGKIGFQIKIHITFRGHVIASLRG